MHVTILPGLPVSISDPRTETTALDDNTNVPASAVFIAGRAFSQVGEAYIAAWPAGGLANQTVQYHGGKAVRGDGAQIVLAGGVVAAFIHGLGYTARGELVVDTAAPNYFPNAIGAVDAAGTAAIG